MSKIKEIKDALDRLDLEGDANSVIECLQTIIKNHKKNGYFKFIIEKDKEYGYGYSEGYEYHQLYGIRLETAEEVAKREAISKKKSEASKKAAKTRAAKKEERELKQYKKLHAKYKGKI